MFRVLRAAAWYFVIPAAIMLAMRFEEGLNTSSASAEEGLDTSAARAEDQEDMENLGDQQAEKNKFAEENYAQKRPSPSEEEEEDQYDEEEFERQWDAANKRLDDELARERQEKHAHQEAQGESREIAGVSEAEPFTDVSFWPTDIWASLFGKGFTLPDIYREKPSPYIESFLDKAFMSTCGCMREFLGDATSFKTVKAVDKWMTRQKLDMSLHESSNKIQENSEKCEQLQLKNINEAVHYPVQVLSDCCSALKLGEAANGVFTPVAPFLRDVVLVSADYRIVIRIFAAGPLESMYQVFIVEDQAFKKKDNSNRSHHAAWMHILFNGIHKVYGMTLEQLRADAKKEKTDKDKSLLTLVMQGLAIIDTSSDGSVSLQITNEEVVGITFHIRPNDNKKGKHDPSYSVLYAVPSARLDDCESDKPRDPYMCGLVRNRTDGEDWFLAERTKRHGQEKYYGTNAGSCRLVDKTIAELDKEPKAPLDKDAWGRFEQLLLKLAQKTNNSKANPKKLARAHTGEAGRRSQSKSGSGRSSSGRPRSNTSKGSHHRSASAHASRPKRSSSSSLVALGTSECGDFLSCIAQFIGDIMSSLFGFRESREYSEPYRHRRHRHYEDPYVQRLRNHEVTMSDCLRQVYNMNRWVGTKALRHCTAVKFEQEKNAVKTAVVDGFNYAKEQLAIFHEQAEINSRPRATPTPVGLPQLHQVNADFNLAYFNVVALAGRTTRAAGVPIFEVTRHHRGRDRYEQTIQQLGW